MSIGGRDGGIDCNDRVGEIIGVTVLVTSPKADDPGNAGTDVDGIRVAALDISSDKAVIVVDSVTIGVHCDENAGDELVTVGVHCDENAGDGLVTVGVRCDENAGDGLVTVGVPLKIFFNDRALEPWPKCDNIYWQQFLVTK